MSSLVHVAIHESQSPENVRRDLLESLRTRRVNHKFHYDSIKQTQKWLALHQAYSPSRTDEDCAATYDKSFEATAKEVSARSIHLIGLGCGGGQKDTRLLMLFRGRGTEVFYSPCDVATAMVLTARETALSVLPEQNCFPLVLDLASAHQFASLFELPTTHNASRIITFFGMIPNFEPETILPKLASLIRPNDFLLFSANLAPGTDYAAGVQKILPLYDNALTRDWLMTFLLDLGVEQNDGALSFSVEEEPMMRLKKVVARFHFCRSRDILVFGEHFKFHSGDSIQLFFSYRYTPELVVNLLKQHGLTVLHQGITQSGEEGVFLCQRA